MKNKFMIHFQGSAYSEELYDDRGAHIYTLAAAIKAAEEQFGDKGWEVYNGNEGEERFIH